jgi:alpha-L-arabinofuranosidase
MSCCTKVGLVCVILLGVGLAGRASAQEASIAVQLDRPGVQVSPLLYGIFFEEINRAGDGGLYAELVQNRGLEDAAAPVGWQLVPGVGAEASMTLDKSQPLNANNPTSLRLAIAKAGARTGVANVGFRGTNYPKTADAAPWFAKFEEAVKERRECVNGIAVEQGKQYKLSLYVRCDAAFHGPLTASLENTDGTALAEAQLTGIETGWKKFECTLTAAGSDAAARLVLSTGSAGTLWFDVVSLFPADTYKGHPFRRDLTEMLAAMKPGFIRFPGGCYVEGDSLRDAFRWKRTIGDIAERPGHYNLWGYYSNDGLGYHEYLQLCEDLGAEPLFVINCAMSHAEQRKQDELRAAVDVPDLNEYLQDALDAIEYANGPVDSQWGALRAQAGHPAPFNLKYLEIGNENGGPTYEKHYAIFYDAIHQRYPDMRLVVDYKPSGNRPPDIVDEHYYSSAEFFARNTKKYDTYDRAGHKVYVGEYAVTEGAGKAGNLSAALGEAAFMTGMERNSDVVIMCSYAPLFVNPDWRRWNPNAIVFDAARTYGTPSYHCQVLFSQNRADVVLPTEVTAPQTALPPGGMIGVGTWATQAEFKDIRVTQGEKTLFASDFSTTLKPWQTQRGTWAVRDGALCQSGESTDCRAVVGDPSWTDYTLSLKARKLGGLEGFLILFQLRDAHTRCWWNLGGWGNREHGIEGADVDCPHVPAKIETGRWYDIRIELLGGRIRCYLDGQLIHDAAREGTRSLYACAGVKHDSGEVILKVVNMLDRPQETAISLQGSGGKLGTSARAIVLTSSSAGDENTFDAPTRVALHEASIDGLAETFQHTFPANSVTVLRIPRKE